jgi:hypothetical protein
MGQTREGWIDGKLDFEILKVKPPKSTFRKVGLKILENKLDNS